jgi:hypothetical protein
MRSEPLAPPRATARAPRHAWVGGATRVAALALAASALLAACGGDGADAGTDDHDVPEVYISVIRALAPSGAGMPKVVFIEALPGTKLSLEDQATVVQAFGDGTDIRFVDERAEAVDDKAPQARVRRDGVLLQMHPVEEHDRTLTVKATRYVSRDDDTTNCMVLEADEDGWAITSSTSC